jgi:hypothetical protein
MIKWHTKYKDSLKNTSQNTKNTNKKNDKIKNV